MATATARRAAAPSLAAALRASSSCAAPATHTLAHEAVAAGDASSAPPTRVLILHGLLGCARNWRTLARALATRASAAAGGARVEVAAVDLRCHGASATSPRAPPPPHTVAAAAADVNAFATAAFGGPPDALVGHSLGGKVALEAARQALLACDPLPRQLWVLDSPLSARRHGARSPTAAPESASAVLAALASVRSPPPERAAAGAALRGAGLTAPVAAWLASQLVPAPGGLAWGFDLDGANALLASYASTDAWPLLRHPPPGLALRVVVGGASDRWSAAERERLAEAQAGSAAAAAAVALSAGGAPPGSLDVHVLEKAGHWVHSDDPEGLLGLLVPRVAELAAERGSGRGA